MDNEIKKVLLHLSLLQNIGPVTTQILLAKIDREKLSDLYDYDQQKLMGLGISQKRAAFVVEGLCNRQLLEEELFLLLKHNIAFITVFDDEYPLLLKQIQYPPVGIYVQGNIACLHHEKSIAFVGARKAGEYANRAVQKIAAPLASAGFVLVSGGALGTDSFMHQVAVALQAPTVAVLGSGLLQWYPASNRKLFASIIASGGALVSYFPLRMEALPGNFPARNRLISGLSQGTVVVQAAEKSGALITAQFALDQGRDVFAVPGSIEDPLSAGCHALLRQGARLVASHEDVLDELGYAAVPVQEQQMPLFEQSVREQAKEQPPVGDIEKIIAWYAKKPITTDDLMSVTGLCADELMDKLFMMSLEGKIAQDMLGLWAIL